MRDAQLLVLTAAADKVVKAILNWFFAPTVVGIASDDLRRHWAQYLQNSDDTQVYDSSVTELLLREAKYAIDLKLKDIHAIEAKAAAQVAVLGGGLGIVSALANTPAVALVIGTTSLFFAACFCLLVSAAFNVWSIARTTKKGDGDLPRLDIFNSRDVVRDRAMMARVGMSVAEGYFEYDAQILSLWRSKGRIQQVATIAFIAGVFMLASNAAWLDTHPAKAPRGAVTANCVLYGDSLKCQVKR